MRHTGRSGQLEERIFPMEGTWAWAHWPDHSCARLSRQCSIRRALKWTTWIEEPRSDRIFCSYPNVVQLNKRAGRLDHVWVDGNTDDLCAVETEYPPLRRIVDLLRCRKPKNDDAWWFSESTAVHSIPPRRQWLSFPRWMSWSISSNSRLHADAFDRILPHVETPEGCFDLAQTWFRRYCCSEPVEVWHFWCNVDLLVATKPGDTRSSSSL